MDMTWSLHSLKIWQGVCSLLEGYEAGEPGRCNLGPREIEAWWSMPLGRWEVCNNLLRLSFTTYILWRFPKMGGTQNGWFIMEIFNNGWFGTPILGNDHIQLNTYMERVSENFMFGTTSLPYFGRLKTYWRTVCNHWSVRYKHYKHHWIRLV